MALLLLLLSPSTTGRASGASTRNAPPSLDARRPNSAHGSIMCPEGAYEQSSRCVPGGRCASKS
eukprot:3838407-Alexandrium_andersonii.AAC.1